MRIATLSNAAVVHTRRWVEYFRARGHDVRVWSLEPGPPELDVRPLPRLPLPGALRYPLAAGTLRRALAAFDPDVIDAHYVPNYGVLGALSGRRPLVVSAWGSDLLVAARRDPFQAARARFVLGRADAVIADSGNLAAAALAFGAPPERVHEVPWGVDLERFRDRGRRDPALWLSTRMHEEVYDLDTLLRGVGPALERRPDARLLITGEGRLRPALEALAARVLPAGRYEFRGLVPIDELAEILARASIVLSASHSDSTSVSLLEAMAAGAVPVVSDIEGNREWVSEGEGARMFRVGDPSDVTRALERALADPDWLERARARNRREIEARGDARANMRRIETLFATLAAAAGRVVTPAGSGR